MFITVCKLRITQDTWGTQDEMQTVMNDFNCIPNAWLIYTEESGEKGAERTHTHTKYRDRVGLRTSTLSLLPSVL